MGRTPELGRERREDLLEVHGHADGDVALPHARLLLHDLDLVLERLRVVRAHLRPEPVLQRRDDPAAVRVVVGVRGGHEQEVEREPDPVAADLDVALLEDVEQGDLDAFGQVGELVDRDDAPIGPGDHPVVDRELVGQVPALGDPDGVDVADQVGHARVRCRELLRVPVLAADPADRRRVPVLGEEGTAGRADRVVRVVVHLAPRDRRRLLVQEVHDLADQAGLGLPPFAEHHEVVACEETAFEHRQHGVLEPHDLREQRDARAELLEQVRAELLLDAPIREPGRSELGDRRGLRHDPSLAAPWDRPVRPGRAPCTRVRTGVRPGGGRSPPRARAASTR